MKLHFKSVNFLLFALYPLLAAFISFKFDVSALSSTVVFYGIPGLYLAFRKPSFIKKSLFFSLVSVPVIIVVDYIAEVSGTWFIPTHYPKLLGYVSLEVIAWAFLHCFVVIMFYEYFFDIRTRSKILYPREKLFFSTAFIAFILFLLLLFFGFELYVPYWYLIFSLVIIVPPVIFEGFKYPRVFLKLIKASSYFFYLNLVYELVALKIGWWSFPGKHYIGWVSFFDISFPFEEFFFWITLFTLAILSCYEYFFDREVA